MKVLVYGTGGIGSLTVHALCRAGNETAVAAKGKRREILREKGMQIRTHSGRKRWTDHPEVLDHEDESFFDAVFSEQPEKRGDGGKTAFPWLVQRADPLWLSGERRGAIRITQKP